MIASMLRPPRHKAAIRQRHISAKVAPAFPARRNAGQPGAFTRRTVHPARPLSGKPKESSVMPLDKGKNGFALSPLPYAEEALAPIISAKTISFHYGKHHKAYVDKLNELIEGTAYADMSLEDIVKKSAKSEKDKSIFNDAA